MSAAEILRENKNPILKNWLHKVRKEMPIIETYDETAIENSVPNLLDAIVLQLESDDGKGILLSSRLHGVQRASFKNYSLRHIIREYILLKSEILHFLDNGNVTKAEDRDDVIFVFDQAIEEAAESFYVVKQGVHVKAKKAAERKANEIKLEGENREEFIQSITHDLSSPLNNIKGCIYLLGMDLEIDRLSKVLNILKTSANQADTLINDFLDVGKVSNGKKLPFARSDFDIVEVLENEIEVFQIAQNREVEFKPQDESTIVSLDLDLFRRSISNLINNALKHGHRSSKIVVNCHENEESVVVSVQNYGPIIAEKDLKSIFNRYYQGEGDKKGWGIGLAFVKEVAKAHGGEVNAESNEADGTTFNMIFPKGGKP